MLLEGSKTEECHHMSSRTIQVKLDPDLAEGRSQRI